MFTTTRALHCCTSILAGGVLSKDLKKKKISGEKYILSRVFLGALFRRLMVHLYSCNEPFNFLLF